MTAHDAVTTHLGSLAADILAKHRAAADDRVAAWLAGHPGETPVLVYSPDGDLVETLGGAS
jgi:hypothetical protein